MKVKLILGNSYADGIVFVKRDNPFVEVSEEEGQNLLNSGYFELVEGSVALEPEKEAPEEGSDEDKEYIIPPVDFDKMKVDELKTYAKENEIDISGLTTKSEIKKALLDAINSCVPEIFTE